MKKSDSCMKKKISSKGNRLVVKKYATTDWKRKTTVKTYSKNRPCNVKISNCDAFDDVFESKSSRVKVEEYPFQVIKTEIIESPRKSKDRANVCREDRMEHIDNKKGTNKRDRISSPFKLSSFHDEVTDNIDCMWNHLEVLCDKKEPGDTPKNSTCIEGGEGIKMGVITIPLLSPIPAFEKTNIENVSMELTKPVSHAKSSSQSVDYLSTIGNASPYVLAALSTKKKKSIRKFDVMSFITEKVKESRLVLPKNISVEEEADAKEQSSSQQEYNKVDDDAYFNQEKLVAEGKTTDLLVVESDTENPDVDPPLVDYSPPLTQATKHSTNQDCLQIQDTSITPEDKDGSVREVASAKLRRSLAFQPCPVVPVDVLLLVPPNPTQASYRTRRIKRSTVGNQPENFPVDILLL